MQSKGSTVIFVTIIVIGSLLVLMNLSKKASTAIPFPEIGENSTSTVTQNDPNASTTADITLLREYSDSAIATSSLTYVTKDIRAPKGIVHAQISSDDATREQGLSDRDSLPKDSGMLFVFPNAGVYGFWMKDMRFALDIVWIDAHRKVVSVDSGVSPKSFPNVFYPPSQITYVLELNSGASKNLGIAPGTELVF